MTRKENSNKPIAYCAILRNKKKQKRPERRVKRSIARCSRGSRAVKLLIDPGSGDLIDANPAAEHFYGYAVDDLKRMKISDINILPPKQIFAEMAKAKTMHRQQFFFRHRLASGEIRDVEVHSSPLDLGDTRLLYSIVHDITERKKAEDAIWRAKRDWESTFDAVSDMVMVVDTLQRLRRVNVALAEQLGATPRDLVGKLCYEVIHGLNYPPDYCPHASVMWIGSHLRERDSRVLEGESVEIEAHAIHSRNSDHVSRHRNTHSQLRGRDCRSVRALREHYRPQTKGYAVSGSSYP